MSYACGLYYKHVTIINDDSSTFSKWNFKLSDDARVAIYDPHMFIVQATGLAISIVCAWCAPLEGKLWLYSKI